MKKCPYCFAEIHSEAQKCKHCGEWVTQKPEIQNEQGISKADLDESLKTVNFVAEWKIIGAFIAIPIMIFILFFVYAGEKEDALEKRSKELIQQMQLQHEANQRVEPTQNRPQF